MSSGGGFESINPATGERIERFAAATASEIEAALEAADRAQRQWRLTPVGDRADSLRSAARLLRERRSALATILSREMGKPLAEAHAEIDKSAWNCEHVAAQGPQWLEQLELRTEAARCYVAQRPIGVLFAIMPWNFPVWQVFRFAPAALIAGNAVILKHAPNVPRSALSIAELLREAGFAEGVFQNLFLSTDDVPAVIGDRRVAAVTLTGGLRAGAAVAALAGAALKKSVLELGGSDPFIVLADADLNAAALAGAKGRFANCGQVCIAPKRFLLDESIAEEFIQRFDAAAAQLVVGDPLSEGTTLGPLARQDLRDELHRLVETSVGSGAKVLRGGAPLEGPGAYYAPTILDDVTPSMAVAQKETFGPVAAMLRFRSDAEAVSIANSTPYGLSSNIWTRDTDRAQRLATEIDAGGVFVNGVTASDPRTPIGGVKTSGYGRELGPWGMREFVNLQTVSINR